MCKLCNNSNPSFILGKGVSSLHAKELCYACFDYFKEHPCSLCCKSYRPYTLNKLTKKKHKRSVDDYIVRKLEKAYMQKIHSKEFTVLQRKIAYKEKNRTKTAIEKGIYFLTEDRIDGQVSWYLFEARRVDKKKSIICKTLQEALAEKSRFLATATKHKHGEAREHKWIHKKEYSYGTRFMVAIQHYKKSSRPNFSKACKTLKEAIIARDNFLEKEKQNENK